MSQAPQKVTIFGASTGNLGRSVVYELGPPGKVNPIPFHPRDEQSIRDCIGNSDIVLNFVGKYYETKNIYFKKNYTLWK